MQSKEFDKVKPYVYWIKDKTTGIKYFGVRWANVSKKRSPTEDFGKFYFSSGDLKKDFKKNPDNFRIKLIATFDTKEEARDYEVKETRKLIKDKRYANIASYPQIIATPETRRKISEANKNPSAETRRKMSEAKQNVSAETRRKLSEANKNPSAEARRKLSEAKKGEKHPNYGKKLSAETRRKMSKAQKRRGPPSAEARRKMTEAQKRRGPPSVETKRKISKSKEGPNNFMYGKKHSEEARRKMSEARKRREAKRII